MVFGAKVSRHQSRREQDYEVVGLHVGSREGVPSLGQTSSTQIPNHTSLRRPISRIFNEFHSHPWRRKRFLFTIFRFGIRVFETATECNDRREKGWKFGYLAHDGERMEVEWKPEVQIEKEQDDQ
jgi:hypothetical protein